MREDVVTMIGVRRIGEIDVAVLEKEQALSLAVAAVVQKQCLLICFANAHTINTARRVKGFSDAMRRALVLNDGIGIDMASRWLYRKPFPSNLNGTDFTPELIGRFSHGTRLFLLGGAPGVAEKAGRAICEQHDHVEIVGARDGFFADIDEIELLADIGRSETDIVLVAMGHPRQEMWAARNISRVGVPMMCVGALLDFYSGTARRAPLWLRRLRLEWVFRLLREPRRLARRYLLGNGVFLAHVLVSIRSEKLIQAKQLSRAGEGD